MIQMGRPDPISKVRPLSWIFKGTETEEESRYYRQQIELNTYHHNFWQRNNSLFDKEKQLFARHFGQSEVPEDQWATFYKDFIVRHAREHACYNREWWRKNIQLMILGIRAIISRSILRKQ
jgi:hypothetical protein